ncbi:MAG: signal peptidase I [Planctomycetota bacterium]|nr:signal peptidase I [Planctomycetota bacterium]
METAGEAANAGTMESSAQIPVHRPMTRTLLVRAAWTLALLAIAVLFVRTFVGDVYHVDSGSMEPTLWGAEGGGEWVFVRFSDERPARQDLVVAQRPGDDAPIVKRALGLPGESVQVSGGDVLVNGRRLAPDASRPPWVVVYDQAVRPLEERFPTAAAQRLLWSAGTDFAGLDARAVPRDANLGLRFFHDPLDDDYLGPDGELVRGTSQASDARVELDVVPSDVGSQLRVGLSEQGDTFQALVRPVDDGACEVSITRRNAFDGLATLASARIAWPVGESRRIAFQNRDNELRLEIAGAAPLSAAYREDALHPSDLLGEGRSYGYRVWFGGDQGRFEFRRVRVLRDFSYTDRGAFGVGAPCELGPDEYFLLGDHSSQSRDSRESGPVHAREIVGRPVAVVWPPARWRLLRPTESGS